MSGTGRTGASAPARGRRGPRPAGSDTRADILAAARGEFAARGFDATSIRAVARSAGVDPALVHHYFDSKERLLLASLGVQADPAAVLRQVAEGGLPGAGERLVRAFLEQWDDPERGEGLLGVLRAAVAGDEVAVEVRQLLLGVYGQLTRRLGVRDPALSAALVASQMGGLALARYVLRAEPLAGMDADAVVGVVAPTLQRYLEA